MKIYLLLIILAVGGSICFGQRQLNGKVTEVISGDTLVLETTGAKFNIRLQYVDAPEEDQPLYATVKSHLSQFVLNKELVVRLGPASDGRYSGQVFLNGADLSLQMLRDGAVWYSVPDSILQDSSEKWVYKEHERLAKDEKRGIWGVPGMKPAYELRLEREKALKEKLEKQQLELAKEAVALAKLREPVRGMPLIAFDALCPIQPGDYVSTSSSRSGLSVFRSLKRTREREDNSCWGDFSFDENLRLTAITRAGFVK